MTHKFKFNKNNRKKIHLSLMIILTCSMMIYYQPSSISAYGAGPHELIIDKSLDMIRNSHSSLVAQIESNNNQNMINYAQHDADWEDDLFGIPVAAGNHYMSYSNHHGLMILPPPYSIYATSAGELAQSIYIEALKHYQSYLRSNSVADLNNAYYALGYVLHLLGDMTVPFHATGIGTDGHDDYESYISNWDHVILNGGTWSDSSFPYPLTYPSYTGSPLFPGSWSGTYPTNLVSCQYSSSAPHCDPNTVHGWLDYAAHFSERYLGDVNCYDIGNCQPGSYSNYERFMAGKDLIRFGADLTAGFLVFWSNSISQLTQLEYSDTYSYLSGRGQSTTHYANNLPYGRHRVVMIGNEDADFDLCVKFNSVPTSNYDCDKRSSSGDSFESVEVDGSNIVYMRVYSYSGYGSYKLYLINGFTTDISSKVRGSISGGGWNYHTITGINEESWIFMSGTEGRDLDLFARWYYSPSIYTYDAAGRSGYPTEGFYLPEYYFAQYDTIRFLLRNYNSNSANYVFRVFEFGEPI